MDHGASEKTGAEKKRGERAREEEGWHFFLWRWVFPHFRKRRMALFAGLFRPGDDTRILDVGGDERYWHLIEAKPQVTLLNLVGSPYRQGRFTFLLGDALSLTPDDCPHDLIFSNSVIEHVGGFAEQQRFAAIVRGLGRPYFIQTPNRGFPVEPHFGALFVQFLPRRWQVPLIRYASLYGLTQKPSAVEIEGHLNGIRLLSRREMAELFPDARIVEEKLLFLTKSLIAVRPPADGEYPRG